MGKPPPVSPSQLEGTISAPKIRVHEVAFSDPVEFLEALSPGGLFVGSHVYRGQADHTWSLAPSAFRDNIPYILSREFFPSKDRAYGTQVKLEIELLWLFVARADTAGLTIPGETERVREIVDSIRRDGCWVAEPKNLRKWPPRELIPALSLAQHHGIPTRLLDWTYDARVAIYFAAEGAARRADRSGRLAVWVCALKEDRISVAGAPSLEIARPSSAFNANLRAQRGCLMVWRKGARPEQLFNRHSMEEELSAEADRSGVRGLPIFYKLTLPQTESGSLLQLLSLQQIDGSTLFPGFDGVARVIRERIYWEGFEGTGGTSNWQAVLNQRSQKIADKWMKNIPVYQSSYDENDDDRLRKLLKATRTVVEAGDYDPRLPQRIEAFERIKQQLETNADEMRLGKILLGEVTELIAKLKSLE